MPETSARIALLFDSFGPYHLARLAASRLESDVIGIEASARSHDYPWFKSTGNDAIVEMYGTGDSRMNTIWGMRQLFETKLDALSPDVVAVPGWSSPAALCALAWCARRRRPAIMMSDSTLADAPRRALPEFAKRAILRGCSAGLVSGQRARVYLETLGMPADRIEEGYDVVDNRHFAQGAERARKRADAERSRLNLPSDYILFVGRLIEKKNVSGLLRAYALYRERTARARPLCIAGRGPLEHSLQKLAAELKIEKEVHFVGHIDYADLPSVYAFAHCLILPSRIEQWGLVVNEAIATGLPLLLSERCGSAADLLAPDRNGYAFDPTDVEAMSRQMARLCEASSIERFRRESHAISAQWGTARFAAGLRRCADIALRTPRHAGPATRLLLSLLLRTANRSPPAAEIQPRVTGTQDTPSSRAASI